MGAPAVLRRRHADDFAEERTERAERRAAHGDAGIGDRPSLPQKGLGTLDAVRSNFIFFDNLTFLFNAALEAPNLRAVLILIPFYSFVKPAIITGSH